MSLWSSSEQRQDTAEVHTLLPVRGNLRLFLHPGCRYSTEAFMLELPGLGVSHASLVPFSSGLCSGTFIWFLMKLKSFVSLKVFEPVRFPISLPE